MKKTSFSLALMLGGMLSAASAQAACTQADAAGRWTVHSMNSYDQVVRCTVSVNAYGTIAQTTCTGFYGSSSQNVPMYGGSITLTSSTRCAFRGSLNFAGTVNTLREMALSSNKSVAQGIGTFSGGTFMLSMTRY